MRPATTGRLRGVEDTPTLRVVPLPHDCFDHAPERSQRSLQAFAVPTAFTPNAIRTRHRLDPGARSGPHPQLALAAHAVAEAASRFNAEAYRMFHAAEEDAWMPLDQLTERTEVLAELWADLASAFSG